MTRAHLVIYALAMCVLAAVAGLSLGSAIFPRHEPPAAEPALDQVQTGQARICVTTTSEKEFAGAPAIVTEVDCTGQAEGAR